jgi:hypothetical protein
VGSLFRGIKSKYHKYLLKYEIYQFDRYRRLYDSFSFNYKIRKAGKWLKQYPEQAHFNFTPVNHWLENIVEKPASVLEIGGWRGDLAEKALSSFEHIKLWHNYDLLKHNNYQNCYDIRYKLISLEDYIWCLALNYEYNALIATHMIEHINWKEFLQLINWIPKSIKTVLFEAPLPTSCENINWRGDHSSHILEKGWKQVKTEMENHRFTVEYTADNTVIFKRLDLL